MHMEAVILWAGTIGGARSKKILNTGFEPVTYCV